MKREKNVLLAIVLALLVVDAPFSMIGVAAGQPVDYEGFGAVTGGAEDSPDGYEVYHVTKLDDDGSAGTLRDAVSQGSRLIVFDIGGTITLTGDLNVDESYITIDGSTAPHPGITIVQPGDIGTVIMPDNRDAHDIVIRYLRMDGQATSHENSGDIWGLDGMDGHVYNIIIDHCIGIASTDGVFDIYGEVSDVTISWCLMMDTVTAMHCSTADIDQVRQNISFHHNVLARNNERQVRFRHHNEMVDFVNNVIYGWGWFESGGYGLGLIYDAGEQNTDINVEANVFHYVDTGHGGHDDAIILESGGDVGSVYFDGNIVPSGEDDAVSNSGRLPIPAYAELTKYDASTLGDTVVPYVGTHYPTQEEQDLLSTIRTAVGGGQGYILSVSSTIGGLVTNPGEGSFPYGDGVVVEIEAVADPSYHFVNWTGTAVDADKVGDASAASTTVTMDANYAIHANFAVDQQVPADMNWDGLTSIVGDVPLFVQVVYFGDYAGYEEQFPGKDPNLPGDCNGDGILSIIGDVPCFVDCVYFDNCAD